MNGTLIHSELVFESNGKVVTDSLMIAEVFNKRHDNVMSDVKTQMDYAGVEFSLLNFKERTYENRGRRYPKIDLTEEAFTLIVMSYNTKEAVQMKIKFIEEFKRMKQHIQNQQKVPKDPMSVLKLTFEALEGQAQEIRHIKSDVKDLRENAPLYAVECIHNRQLLYKQMEQANRNGDKIAYVELHDLYQKQNSRDLEISKELSAMYFKKIKNDSSKERKQVLEVAGSKEVVDSIRRNS